MSGGLRAFVACPVPALAGPAARVQAALPFGRPVPEENLHLTLAFLGDRTEAELAALDLELEQLSAAPVRVDVTGLTTLGHAPPRLLAFEVAPDAGLSALHDRVAAARRRAGIDTPRRRFRPHVTLARFSGRADARRLGAWMAGTRVGPLEAWLEELVLYRSDLGPDGASHTPLARYALGWGGGPEGLDWAEPEDI